MALHFSPALRPAASVQVKVPREGAIRHPPSALETLARLINDVREFHQRGSPYEPGEIRAGNGVEDNVSAQPVSTRTSVLMLREAGWEARDIGPCGRTPKFVKVDPLHSSFDAPTAWTFHHPYPGLVEETVNRSIAGRISSTSR